MHAEAYKIFGFVLLFDFHSLDFFEIQMPCEEVLSIC